MKTKILDLYFKAALFVDYILGVLVFLVFYLFDQKLEWTLPKLEKMISVISDLANVSLTTTGFILTLLTLLITFKSSTKLKIDQVSLNDSRFDIFFASDLYFETIRHLKNAMKSLLFLSIFGYLVKILVVTSNFTIYFACIMLLVVLILTLLRCLLILNLILSFQKSKVILESET